MVTPRHFWDLGFYFKEIYATKTSIPGKGFEGTRERILKSMVEFKDLCDAGLFYVIFAYIALKCKEIR